MYKLSIKIVMIINPYIEGRKKKYFLQNYFSSIPQH